MACKKGKEVNIEVRRVGNGVIVIPRYSPSTDTFATVEETRVFDDRQDFLTHMGDWWDLTEIQ